jgi:cytochrome c peroxidase
MRKSVLIFLAITVVVFACKHEPFFTIDNELEELIGDLNRYILPNSDDYANIPQSPVNPMTAEKVNLGKMLFFEPAFGVEAMHPEGLRTFSCGSCHIPAAGFRPGRLQGIADGGVGFGLNGEGRAKFPGYDASEIDAQGARPLSVLNVAFVSNTMWNGSFGSDGVNAGTEHRWGLADPGTAINHQRLGALEGQNIEGLIVHRLLYNQELVEENGYKAFFDAAFPDVPEAERYNRKTASFAISAYLRSLTTTEAPFQRWLKGDKTAMSDEQKRGAILFFDKAGCYRCHNEPNLGSVTFHALGVQDLFENGGLKTSEADLRNLGRGGFTGNPADMFKFRVPQLYNIGDSGPYFHGSSKQTLEEVVEYFNNGVHENPRVPNTQISAFFHPLGLDAAEMKDLTAFLRYGLRDPKLDRFMPKEIMSGMCFPNNDPLSRAQMGCD